MSDYISKWETIAIKHISETIELKSEHLCINRQMEDRDVHWHRGYIAAMRDVGIFIQNELSKKLQES